jgi:hypothetical protein
LGQKEKQSYGNTKKREEFVRRTGVLSGSLREREGRVSWSGEEDLGEVVWMIVRCVVGL